MVCHELSDRADKGSLLVNVLHRAPVNYVPIVVGYPTSVLSCCCTYAADNSSSGGIEIQQPDLHVMLTAGAA